jgi:hypothetical protein
LYTGIIDNVLAETRAKAQYLNLSSIISAGARCDNKFFTAFPLAQKLPKQITAIVKTIE